MGQEGTWHTELEEWPPKNKVKQSSLTTPGSFVVSAASFCSFLGVRRLCYEVKRYSDAVSPRSWFPDVNKISTAIEISRPNRSPRPSVHRARGVASQLKDTAGS
uniref:(northern house mosquito) hypothetical protein n=1 Tax=Culex pipiens TaxID=7175 RepID=A0A8D8GIS0_CULPI